MADPEDSRERRLAAKRAHYAANRQRYLTTSKAWKKNNKDRDNERRRTSYATDPTKVRDAAYAWRERNPELFAYMKHRQDAKERGVPFLITFDEWWDVWHASGKWPMRGLRKGQYVMARFGDKGGYEVGNVRICTSSENVSERHQVNPMPSKRGPYRKRRHD
jgi:hypothetical protein